MAGLSRRFEIAGYSQPKFMLPLHGKSVFAHSVGSFKKYFKKEKFLFIARNESSSFDFIQQQCDELGIANYSIVNLDAPTRGQAETVNLGLKKAAIGLHESITIFNIDTFRPGYTYPDLDFTSVSGYLEVFEGSGKNWSYVKPVADGSNRVIETAEKREISNLCCTGLYHFSSCKDFFAAYDAYEKKSLKDLDGGELYVAPLYNYLIKCHLDIRFATISRDDVIFCGVPKEYEELLEKPPSNLQQ